LQTSPEQQVEPLVQLPPEPVQGGMHWWVKSVSHVYPAQQSLVALHPHPVVPHV
jgi:hypothetical protein